MKDSSEIRTYRHKCSIDIRGATKKVSRIRGGVSQVALDAVGGPSSSGVQIWHKHHPKPFFKFSAEPKPLTEPGPEDTHMK